MRFSRHDLRDPGAVVARILTALPSAVLEDVVPRTELLVGPRA